MKRNRTQRRSARHVSALFLIVSLILGSSSLWAMDRQRPAEPGPRYRGIVSGLHGDAWVTPDMGEQIRPLQFHDAVNDGDVLATGPGSLVEVLVDQAVFVRLHEHSTLRFLEGKPGTTAIHLKTGQARLSVARAGPAVTIHTPAATTVTWGGLIHITVTANHDQADAARQDAGSFRPEVRHTSILMKNLSDRVETFDVLEGAFQLRSWMPGETSVTVQPGQRIQVTEGHIGKPMAISTTSQEAHTLPAVVLHTRTSEQGVRHIAAQQKLQAEALQRAMMESLESETMETDNATRSAIISTTGATLPTFAQPTPQPVSVPGVVIATTGTPASQLPQPSPMGPGPSSGPGSSSGHGPGSLLDRILPPGLRFDRR
ncbi:MAG: FecR domain-containing protein [Nitrospiraceae bacterium]